jgi:hypothetical protein
LTFPSVDGGRSRIYNFGTYQGGRRRRFLALMVDAPGSPALTPLRGPVVDVFYVVDGGRSQISVKGPTIDVIFNLGGGRYWTHRQRPPQGPPLMSSSTSVVVAAEPASSAPKGPTIDVLQLSGSHSQTSGNAS